MQHEFLKNLSLVLAHSIVYENKMELVPDGVEDNARGEDESAPNVKSSTNRAINAAMAKLPDYTNAANQQILPNELARLQAAQTTSPEYNQLMTQLYQQYAPQLAQTGAQVENINRAGAANTDLGILTDTGPQLSAAYRTSDQALNPEYYASRNSLANSLGSLLSSADLNRPNVEAERLVNQEEMRTGNAGTPSATNTVANAISFGNEGLKRQNQLAQAISVGSAMLPNMKSSFDPAANAVTRGSTNTGASNFAGVTEPGSESQQNAQDLLNAAGGFQTAAMGINSQKRDVLDRGNETMSSIPC